MDKKSEFNLYDAGRTWEDKKAKRVRQEKTPSLYNLQEIHDSTKDLDRHKKKAPVNIYDAGQER